MPTSRTVLTTGANSGLGLATVIEMAKRGHHSVGTVRSAAKAEIVQKAAAETGVEVETARLDVTDPFVPQTLRDFVLRRSSCL